MLELGNLEICEEADLTGADSTNIAGSEIAVEAGKVAAIAAATLGAKKGLDMIVEATQTPAAARENQTRANRLVAEAEVRQDRATAQEQLDKKFEKAMGEASKTEAASA